MDILLYVAMVLCALSVLLKVSLLEGWKSLGVGVVFIVFCFVMVPATAGSSRLVIEQFFADQEARQWVAIIATVECILALAYGFRDWQTTKPSSPHAPTQSWWRRQSKEVLWWGIKHYISLLIFPTLFFVQTQCLYALPGSSFYFPATIVGVGALVLTPLIAWLLKQAFPSRRDREESLLYCSVALSILVLISTNHDAVLTRRPSYAQQLEWGQLLWAGAIILVLFAIGYITSKIIRHKK